MIELSYDMEARSVVSFMGHPSLSTNRARTSLLRCVIFLEILYSSIAWSSSSCGLFFSLTTPFPAAHIINRISVGDFEHFPLLSHSTKCIDFRFFTPFKMI